MLAIDSTTIDSSNTLSIYDALLLSSKGCLVEGCVACTLGSLSCGFVLIDDDSEIRVGIDPMDGGTYIWSRYTLIYNVNLCLYRTSSTLLESNASSNIPSMMVCILSQHGSHLEGMLVP
jgi:hypothetical protein